jgi:RNA polymerase sigma factor (sigma-70 family)
LESGFGEAPTRLRAWAARTDEVAVDDPEIDRENARWVRALAAGSPSREAACSELYRLLLRVGRAEARRRAPLLRLDGPELEDIAHEAVADALMAICDRLQSFRGEARFTTWASKFVIFNVANKMNRHFWRRHEVPYDQEDWSRLASGFDTCTADEVEVRDLAAAVSVAVQERLSDRQRLVFIATVLNGMPIDVLAHELGSTRNALYKVLFDARRKLRMELEAGGYLPPVSRPTSSMPASSMPTSSMPTTSVPSPPVAPSECDGWSA